jgi:hypothetical protein
MVREENFRGNTADLKTTGFAQNGDRYALKTLSDGPLLPLTEWLCYGICREIGIATPGFDIVERVNGTLAFGSRWDADTVPFGSRGVNAIARVALVSNMGAQMIKPLILDYFLPNPDRHFNNFLYRKSADNHEIVLAFDWSRVDSLKNQPLFSPWPWGQPCNSATSVAILKRLQIWDTDVVASTARAIESLPSQKIRAILEGAPETWCPEGLVDSIVVWWENSAPQRARGLTP